MNKVLLINGSNREGFNQKILEEINKNVSNFNILKLRDSNIEFCRGCLQCDKLGKCIINDDLELIINKIKESNTIVFAIPNYFGGMSGFFKNFIDRFHFMYKRSILKDKNIIFIYTGAWENDSITMEDLTESTSKIERYLEMNVIKRVSFSSRKELDLNKVKELISLLNVGE